MTGEGGYTGTGWYFEDPNNGLHEHGSEEDFKRFLVEQQPASFDDILSDWDPEEKAAFLNSHLSQLESGNCVYFTAESPNT